MTVKHHLEFLSLIGGCIGSSKSTLVKMSHCWKSHAMTQMYFSGANAGLVRVVASGINEQTKVLDRESRSSYVYRILASDNSFQTATATLSIAISDINDYKPSFTNGPYIFSIAENSAPQAIGTVSVSEYILV